MDGDDYPALPIELQGTKKRKRSMEAEWKKLEELVQGVVRLKPSVTGGQAAPAPNPESHGLAPPTSQTVLPRGKKPRLSASASDQVRSSSTPLSLLGIDPRSIPPGSLTPKDSNPACALARFPHGVPMPQGPGPSDGLQKLSRRERRRLRGLVPRHDAGDAERDVAGDAERDPARSHLSGDARRPQRKGKGGKAGAGVVDKGFLAAGEQLRGAQEAAEGSQPAIKRKTKKADKGFLRGILPADGQRLRDEGKGVEGVESPRKADTKGVDRTVLQGMPFLAGEGLRIESKAVEDLQTPRKGKTKGIDKGSLHRVPPSHGEVLRVEGRAGGGAQPPRKEKRKKSVIGSVHGVPPVDGERLRVEGEAVKGVESPTKGKRKQPNKDSLHGVPACDTGMTAAGKSSNSAVWGSSPDGRNVAGEEDSSASLPRHRQGKGQRVEHRVVTPITDNQRVAGGEPHETKTAKRARIAMLHLSRERTLAQPAALGAAGGPLLSGEGPESGGGGTVDGRSHRGATPHGEAVASDVCLGSSHRNKPDVGGHAAQQHDNGRDGSLIGGGLKNRQEGLGLQQGTEHKKGKERGSADPAEGQSRTGVLGVGKTAGTNSGAEDRPAERLALSKGGARTQRSAAKNGKTGGTSGGGTPMQMDQSGSVGGQSSGAALSKGGRSSVLGRMQQQLQGGFFRYLNEQLYTTDGASALSMMQQRPQLYEEYHRGFRKQTEGWPVQPVDVAIRWLKGLPAGLCVADFGCGDARLAASVPQAVQSLDLVAGGPGVVACNMAHTPLGSGSVDVVVFCLALMGTDYPSFLHEAARVLRKGGTLWIAEVRSRFAGSSGEDDFRPFVAALEGLGFALTKSDVSNKMFVIFTAGKRGRPTTEGDAGCWPVLKPCIYKRR